MPNQEINLQGEIQTLRDVMDQLCDIGGCILHLKEFDDERVKSLASVMNAYMDTAQEIMESAVDSLEVFVDRQVDGQENKKPQAEDQAEQAL